jgi:hypothetical protein
MKKLWKLTIAAAFSLSLLTLSLPGLASAETIVVQPTPIQQVAYYPFATVYGYHPWACSNPWFRRHHHRMCW